MRTRLGSLSLVLLFVAGLVGFALLCENDAAANMEPYNPSHIAQSQFVFLPSVTYDYLSPSDRLCRFGVGGGQSIRNYGVNALRIGWYIDWTTTSNPAQPGGIDYMPMVRLKQTGSASYTYFPDESLLLQTIALRPGATWLIGNEPDRRYWQDDLDPDVYARAYHDLYHLIKAVDPTARIAAGSIVQPTPLRLQYLDMVLESYQTLYGETMPVDVWNIHAFILREEAGSWGAEIPPGIDANHGELYEIDDNDSIEIFKQNIALFRQWMAANGYRTRPLIITEFGVQMPPDFGFPPDRVQTFLEASFDYLLTATDTATGYPYDENRLVQQWAWYSLTDDNYNGWLFDPITKERTVYGDFFASYTKSVEPEVNLTVVSIEGSPVLSTSGEVMSATLRAKIVNNGNISTSNLWDVQFYLGDPEQGGVLIGERTVYALDGCATSTTVEVVWDDASSGSHDLTVVVDPDDVVGERNEQDNKMAARVSF